MIRKWTLEHQGLVLKSSPTSSLVWVTNYVTFLSIDFLTNNNKRIIKIHNIGSYVDETYLKGLSCVV